MIKKSSLLKISLFATGCAGIVAEFVLSTIATYLIGNAVFQWAIVMSLMLFAMGLGSRLSRHIADKLLDAFIITEFALSLLCAISAELAYGLSSYSSYVNLIIYTHALAIGTLIGLEIPLVIRLNQEYEDLRVNISDVMEKDYLGSLFGGLFFAFFALPYLGLTYTPIFLGSINFLVASLLYWHFNFLVVRKKLIALLFAASFVFLILLGFFAVPIIRYGEQQKYKDKVIYSAQTSYQKIVITKWKKYYWLYINGQEQFSTFDEEKYHEPLVHPAMRLSSDIKNVLILGGGDGLALREVLKYDGVETVLLVDIDPDMTSLAKKHPVLLSVNQGALNDIRVKLIHEDAARFIAKDSSMYGVIIIDLPDPDSIDLIHLYSEKFYNETRKHLIAGGVLVTQATSPFFARDAFLCIIKTMEKSGFHTIPYHNHIPTMGEWGWVIGLKKEDVKSFDGKKNILNSNFKDIKTRFLNQDALISMFHFGKGIFDKDRMEKIKVNSELNPVLYQYYLSGSWGMY